jgi:hypothetical protein
MSVRVRDADGVAVADRAGVPGGQLEEPDLLPDERGSSERVSSSRVSRCQHSTVSFAGHLWGSRTRIR